MKAVLFDVYETLLTGKRLEDRETALRGAMLRYGLHSSEPSIATAHDAEITAAHQRSTVSHPEVDIRKIWLNLFPALTDADGFALAAEEAIHPVTLIPGAAEIVNRLHRAGLVLGIVSNAQCYTRLLLEKHLGDSWHLFDPELRFFSYQHGISKPAPHMFELALAQLAHRRISPQQTLMVGDSAENDIKPARALGLATHRIAPGKLDLPDELTCLLY